MVSVWRCLAMASVLFMAGGLAAQTVYKSIDAKGNVIYSESPPAKTKDGKVRSTSELTIDPNQNVMPAQPMNAYPSTSGPSNQNSSGDAENNAGDAQAALDAAEAELKAGSEVQPGDFMGRAGGGVGPSTQRLQRLEELQRAVDEARQKLEETQAE